MISQNNPLLEYQIKFWREHIKSTLNKALDYTPENKLNWAPAPNMITLGNIFLHIAECSDWWYDEVMNHQKAVELAESPGAPAPAKEQIAQHLEAHWARLERFFKDEPDVLKKTYKIAGHEKTRIFDGYWIITHLLEHDIHHRSQINQYLRILGITPPEI
jgi:uncharacterized damage-inducible protein DinB